MVLREGSLGPCLPAAANTGSSVSHGCHSFLSLEHWAISGPNVLLGSGHSDYGQGLSSKLL